MTRAVDLLVSEGLATIRLTSPENGNAFDFDLTEGLRLAALEALARDDVRCVLVRADGSAFSLGGDIVHFKTHSPGDYPVVFSDLMDRVSEALLALENLDAPVVVAVRGWVVGAGLSLVGAADIVVASDRSRFRTAFTGIGLPGDAGVTWYLTRLLGRRRTAALMLENEPFDAVSALEWGLVTRLVEDDEVDEVAVALATRLASGPTRAFGHTRRNLTYAANGSTLRDHLARERTSTAECAATDDLVNAIEAFASRQIPTFEGR